MRGRIPRWRRLSQRRLRRDGSARSRAASREETPEEERNAEVDPSAEEAERGDAGTRTAVCKFTHARFSLVSFFFFSLEP